MLPSGGVTMKCGAFRNFQAESLDAPEGNGGWMSVPPNITLVVGLVRAARWSQSWWSSVAGWPATWRHHDASAVTGVRPSGLVAVSTFYF